MNKLDAETSLKQVWRIEKELTSVIWDYWRDNWIERKKRGKRDNFPQNQVNCGKQCGKFYF